MDWIADPQAWIALITLTALELVLGIDNIIFISILAGRLPASSRDKARRIGLLLAMVMRILLLLSLSWVIRLTEPLFALAGYEFSGRDLILIGGGLFLLAKSTHEIHVSLEGQEESATEGSAVAANFGATLVQIMLLDVVFSLDSVITAVGMVDVLAIMIIAVVLAVGFMMLFARPVGEFVEEHPTVKILALSFLLLVGMALVADGFALHIPRGYIYFAMGFSVMVEMFNMRLRKRARRPVRLHARISSSAPGE